MNAGESAEAWRARILEEWNDTRVPYPGDACVHELFEEHVRRAPDAPALLFVGGTLTYAELNGRADALAAVLAAEGVGPDRLVGLCLERSPEAIVAILAILKAGGAFAPLDPAYPEDRLAFMLEDTAAPVLITRRGLLERLPRSKARVICWEDLPSLSSFGSFTSFRSFPPSPDNLAYVMYTSGSTGRPKGVAVTHRDVARLARGSRFADFGSGHVFLHLGPLSFDATTLEVGYALLNGSALAIVPPETPSLEELGAFLVRFGVTAAWLTAGLFHQMVEAQLPSLARLRLIMSGGDVLSPSHVARVLEAAPGIMVVNGYGPTESTVFTTCHPMRSAAEVESPLPIGRPIGNTRVAVVDQDLQLCPPGVEGELWIGGDGLARGYLHRPDLTAERFVPDAFWGDREGGGRLYRTGDLVRWRPDGVLDFLGRVDQQVKLRGFRVELGEVEAALASHPDVGEVAVVVQGEGADKRLVAFWVARPDGEPDLRAFLGERMPSHLVPSAFVRMDALPLNANGKVDRRALAAVSPLASRAGRRAATAPRTPAEEILAGIWAELLGLDQVGIDEDFFDLGGHSLVATRLVSRLSMDLGVELSLRDVFEDSTVARLAVRVEEARAAGRRTPPVLPRPRQEGDLLPASFAQERLWLIDRLTPGQAVYNIPLALRLRGSLDLEALERALHALVRRHESLRTTFVDAAGEPRQRIAPFAPLPLAVTDLREHPEGDSEAWRLRVEEALLPFDLKRGPLLRVSVLRLAGEDAWLLLNMHHIVSDGWSMEILTRELAALYSGEELPELPVQYADFAAWQREWLLAGTGEVLERQISWWVDELAGAPALLELPTDRPRPPVPSFRGVRRVMSLPAALAVEASRIARQGGATLFMTLLAAFQALLGRYAGGNIGGPAGGGRDVLVGSPVANRNRHELEGIIGFFANTLVLRGRLDPHDTGSFRELLARVRTSALGAYVHQDLPFERLVEELRIERSMAYNPLFQVVFAFQPPPMQGLELPGLELELEDLQGLTSKFDLFLSLWEAPDGFAGTLDGAADLFDPGTMDRLARCFQALLEGIVERPDRPMSELPLLDPAERSQILEDWNDTRFPYPREACIHELFEEQARKTPGAVALRSPGGEMTYAELDARAGALAGLLIAAGVGPDRLAALCLERSAEAIVAILAILKAGGAFVPLDPSYPAERLAFMLEDTAAPVLITRRALQDRLPETAAQVVCWEDLSPHPPAPSPSPPSHTLPGEGETYVVSGVRGRPSPGAGGLGRTGRGVGGEGSFPENLAYVMYTSGSTGRPKGVAVTHRNVVRLVRNTNFADFGADQVFLQLAPLSFDASTLEIWGPLLNGGTLVVFPPEIPTLEELGGFLVREEITTLWLTAGLFHQMAEAQLPSFQNLRQLLAGGDVLSPPHVSRVLREIPGITLINGYGPTESTTFACCYPMRSPMRSPEGIGTSVPIGRPIGNTRVAILDRGLQPVPLGVMGELYIGGDGLARGYLNRPDLTAESFIPDPVWDGWPDPVWDGREGGERLYRTGDLARWRPDGAVEFLGRADNQVKIRGFRIESGEIEAGLAAHPAVEAAAVVVQGEGADKRLVAFWVPRSDGEPDLRAFLGARLPSHMVPAAFVRMDTLPLNPNGKVDRRALAAVVPVTAAQRGKDAPRAPRTPTEEVLAGIWAELLRVDLVGIDEDFFALGGHSLLATRMVSRLATELGVELSLRTVFEDSTVARLAVRVGEALAAGAQAPPLVPVPRRDGDSLPLSYSQEGLWLVDRLTPGLPVYNIPLVLRLSDESGKLDRSRLETALNAVVRRHEALRTTFQEVEGRPRQVVAPFVPRPLPVADLRSLPEDLRRQEAGLLLRREASLPFDLAAGPLMRSLLVALGAREHVLLLTMHHIVSDGWSVEALAHDLGAFYSGAEPPALPVQYADYAVWQRRWLSADSAGSGGVMARQAAWWREELAGAPTVLEVPADRPRPAVQSFRGSLAGGVLPADLAGALRAFARREGATLFMTLLAALQALLCRLTGRQDLLVGSPVANRNRPEVEGLVGFFVNTLVLRGRLPDGVRFREAVAAARRSALGAYAHQDLPFDHLVAELRVERSLAYSPLFQVMFALQAGAFPEPGLQGVRAETVTLETGTAKFDLLLEARESGEGFGITLEHATDLFDAATADRILERFRVLLEAAVAGPDLSVWDLPVMSAAERSQVLEAWNGADLAVPDLCLHELVGEQIARTPDAVALVGDTGDTGERWTYRDLDLRASRIAARLRELGVGPEVPVGVSLTRAPALVAALLGVLRAGGCYVPLDPAYPKERLALLLEDTNAPVVITESGLADRLPELPGAALLLDREELRDGAWEPSGAVPGNLAYLIYTSGSTGRPKGVAIEHRSAVAFAVWARQVFDDDELSGVFAATSVNFDLSVFELFVPLCWGGRVILGADALALPGHPAAGEVRLVNTVPSAMTELVRMRAVPPSVRTVNLAGEPLRRSLAREIAALGTVGRLLNLYGPSEDTTYSTCTAVPPGEREPTIGRAIRGSWVYLLDRFGSPVPVGVAGELYLGGAGLARGYLGRPELTAERFVPDPLGASGERLYRTGDLARWLPSGEIEYLGRIDHQVKVRGFRIELGEIEAALLGHPAVREAAVLAVGEGGDRRLVAYVAPAALPDLRPYLAERLPDYMVPAAFVGLESLPLTPNGKVDRRALAGLTSVEGRSGGGSATPRTPTEEVLAAVWADLLGLEAVGIDDDFFSLGGHSLLAMRLVFRFSEELGVELPPRAVFEASTVARLAARVDEALASGMKPPPILPLSRLSRGGGMPLSSAQEGLWLADRLAPGLPVYNVPLALRLSGGLDRARLEAALNAVVCRHEALRTTFHEAAGRPVQIIAPFEPRPLPVIDLGALPETSREEESRRQLRREALLPFDLAAGPLLRARLFELGGGEHVLLLATHHIVSDGWSLDVLARDLGAFYASTDLPALPIQYADYAAWQRQWLSGETLASLVSWWRAELAGAPMVLEVPADRPRPAVQSHRGALVHSALPADAAAAVRGLARREGATLFMTLLAAFQALLHRLTGQGDLLVGSPVANRDRPETQGLVGLFVNTLVLRGRFPPDGSFRGAVAAARRAALGAYAHQELPFDQLAAELAVERSLAWSPLFQVMLVLQPGGFAAPEMPGVYAETVALETRTAKFDLLLEARETPEGFGLALEYAADLFDASTAARLLERFAVLLTAAAAGPERAVGELPVMSEAERFQVLEAWNADVLDVPNVCLHDLIAAQTARTPDAVALVGDSGDGGERWTYRDLDRRAGRIAAWLRGLGVGPEVAVGVSLRRTPRLVAALLGVLRAGGCYVPLDPDYPKERLALLLEDTGAPVVITESELADSDAPAEPSGVLPGVLPGNLAYLIYTSGSTGRPKGVAIEHRSAVAFAVWARQVFDDAELAGVFAATSVNFDLSIFELFVPLCWGGRVILGANALALPGHPAAGEVRLVNTVPSAMTELVRMRGIPPSVRTVNLAGEPLRRSLARSIAELGTVERLLNLYGPSEDTTYSTYTEVPPGDREPTIGRPLAGSRVYLVDLYDNPAPIGVAGELCLGGAGLARGYLGRPELTAERFVPDPFGDGGRLYRTGDLARWLPDGELEYLGRIDHQVKVRGFRIELGEIEAALLAHPGVREAAVLALGEGVDRRLVAWVAPEALPDLRSWLAARLPDYMVPAAFAGLPALPLTPNGKVDRRALAASAPERTGAVVGAPPRAAAEELLAGLWADVLGIDGVGIDDDFFALGGHSLLANRLISRVAESFGVDLTLRNVFEDPTVRKLAARIEASAAGVAPAPPILPIPRDGDLPLSFAQERLWFSYLLAPERAQYLITAPLRLVGALDTGALQAALTEIVRRHEILRSTYGQEDGRAVQRAAPAGPVLLPVADLRGLPEEIREPEMLRLAEQEETLPLDLRRGPVHRFRLIRMADEDRLLILSVHHVASDGWSTGILMRELADLYGGASLPPLAVQYGDFAVWQRRWLQEEALESLAGSWLQALEGAPLRIDLPTDRPRPSVRSSRGATLPLTLPREAAARAGAVGRRLGVTPFMIFFAAYEALLHRITGQDDILIGTPVAGRARRETEGLIGCFVNTLVLRGRNEGEEGSFHDLAGRVRSMALHAFAHQDLPFEKLVEAMGGERNLAWNPVFQAFFAFQNAPLGVPRLGDLSVTPVDVPSGVALFDLSLGLGELGGELLGGFQYDAGLFDATTIERWAHHFRILLAAALEDPERPLADLPRIAEPERLQLLATAAPEPEEAAEALQARLSVRQEEISERRSALSGEKRAALQKLLRARPRGKTVS
jgi:amino acid adenylation domain-containing protein